MIPHQKSLKMRVINWLNFNEPSILPFEVHLLSLQYLNRIMIHNQI